MSTPLCGNVCAHDPHTFFPAVGNVRMITCPGVPWPSGSPGSASIGISFESGISIAMTGDPPPPIFDLGKIGDFNVNVYDNVQLQQPFLKDYVE